MKKKLKRYVIRDPIYRSHITLFISDKESIKNYFSRIEELKDVEFDSEASFIYNKNHRWHIIWMEKYDISSLSHELIHYCMEVFNDKNIVVSYENQEVFTYYYEMTLQNILKKIK